MTITDLSEFNLSTKALEQLQTLHNETKWKQLHSKFCISFSYECLKCASISQDLDILREHIVKCFPETEPKRKESYSRRKRLKTSDHTEKHENVESVNAKNEDDKTKENDKTSKDVHNDERLNETPEKAGKEKRKIDGKTKESSVKKISEETKSGESDKRIREVEVKENERGRGNKDIEGSPTKRRRGRPSKQKSEDKDIVKVDDKLKEVETIVAESSNSDETSTTVAPKSHVTSVDADVETSVIDKTQPNKKQGCVAKTISKGDYRIVTSEKQKENKQSAETEPIVFEVVVQPQVKPQKGRNELSETSTKTPIIKTNKLQKVSQITKGISNIGEPIVTLDLDGECENEASYDENIVSLTSSVTAEKQIKQLQANGKLNIQSQVGNSNRNVRRGKPNSAVDGKTVEIFPKVKKASVGRDLNSEEIKAKTCAICKEQQPSIKVGVIWLCII